MQLNMSVDEVRIKSGDLSSPFREIRMHSIKLRLISKLLLRPVAASHDALTPRTFHLGNVFFVKN